MPVYQFKCLQCNQNNFEVKQSLSEYKGKAPCPICGTESITRIYTSFAVHEGLTAAEKVAGTTKQRADTGKYMKSERDKRKKSAEPNSREALSNEYWVGNEVERGIIPGPEPKKQV